ncbi:MAG: ATP-binding protein, partial [Actinomycetota bacterium]|nr:ATP-binding protein [Actinomycetota bacterium]
MAAQKKNAPSQYGADSIKVLEGLEAVRKRPGMYIGSTGERGLHHLIWEVVDNAVDEAMAGFASRVDVRILEDGGVQVTDDGRGIPVGMHSTGIPTVDVVMTVLHAGGKFEEGAYQVSGGLHGVGVSVVNALSTRLEADILTDGYEWFQTYDRSVPGTLKQGEKTKKTGTTIRFWADPDVFETTNYDFETISRRLQEMAFLNKGLTIELTDERVAAEEVVEEVVSGTAEAPKSAEEKAAESAGPQKVKHRVFHYPGGLTDFVKHINRTKTPIQPSVIDFDGKGDGHEVEV